MSYLAPNTFFKWSTLASSLTYFLIESIRFFLAVFYTNICNCCCYFMGGSTLWHRRSGDLCLRYSSLGSSLLTRRDRMVRGLVLRPDTIWFFGDLETLALVTLAVIYSRMFFNSYRSEFNSAKLARYSRAYLSSFSSFVTGKS